MELLIVLESGDPPAQVDCPTGPSADRFNILDSDGIAGVGERIMPE